MDFLPLLMILVLICKYSLYSGYFFKCHNIQSCKYAGSQSKYSNKCCHSVFPCVPLDSLYVGDITYKSQRYSTFYLVTPCTCIDFFLQLVHRAMSCSSVCHVCTVVFFSTIQHVYVCLSLEDLSDECVCESSMLLAGSYDESLIRFVLTMKWCICVLQQ